MQLLLGKGMVNNIHFQRCWRNENKIYPSELTLSELEDLLSPNRRLQLSCDKKIFRCWIDHRSSFHKCINTNRAGAVPRKPLCATLSMPTVEYKHIECFFCRHLLSNGMTGALLGRDQKGEVKASWTFTWNKMICQNISNEHVLPKTFLKKTHRIHVVEGIECISLGIIQPLKRFPI